MLVSKLSLIRLKPFFPMHHQLQNIQWKFLLWPYCPFTGHTHPLCGLCLPKFLKWPQILARFVKPCFRRHVQLQMFSFWTCIIKLVLKLVVKKQPDDLIYRVCAITITILFKTGSERYGLRSEFDLPSKMYGPFICLKQRLQIFLDCSTENL